MLGTSLCWHPDTLRSMISHHLLPHGAVFLIIHSRLVFSPALLFSFHFSSPLVLYFFFFPLLWCHIILHWQNYRITILSWRDKQINYDVALGCGLWKEHESRFWWNLKSAVFITYHTSRCTEKHKWMCNFELNASMSSIRKLWMTLCKCILSH